ncbi:MAG: hypothetical protein IRZ18_08070 [Clostridia bacterium]|nr:hypothetical protein [Clostridia bacterium]
MTVVRRSLRQGHMALLLAGGELDGVVGAGKGWHLVKGFVEKMATTEVNEVEDGEESFAPSALSSR